MPSYRTIYDFPPGDTFTVIRTLDAPADDSTPSDAWFTIKRYDTDNDAMATASVHITPTSSGIGLINVYPDKTSLLTFVVLAGTTSAMIAHEIYYYDIQVKTTSNSVFTLETGKVFPTRTVTQSS